MNFVRGSIAIFKISMYKWLGDIRIVVIFIMTAVYVYYCTGGVLYFSKMIGVKVTQWVFPALFTDYIISMGVSKVIILIGVIFLFCDAPFVDELYPSVVLRSGYKAWCMGQILYISVASFIYALFILLLTVIRFIPYIQFSNEWGKVISTLAFTDAKDSYALEILFSNEVIKGYTPIKAELLTFILFWIVSVMIGLILFVFNTFKKFKSIGAVISLVLILVDPLIQFFDKRELIKLSPVNLISIENLKIKSMSSAPTITYAFIYIGLIITVLVTVALYSKDRVTECLK